MVKLDINLVIIMLLVIGAFVMTQNTISPEPLTIREEVSLAECNAEREDSIDYGYGCVGPCVLITQRMADEFDCRERDEDVGLYGFVYDRDLSCGSLDQDTLDQWRCVYESDPGDFTCSDSDNGLVYDVRGTVTSHAFGQTFTDTDNCVNSNNVAEYYCNGFEVGLQSQFCGNGCSNGKCNAETGSCSATNLPACPFNDGATCLPNNQVCSRSQVINGIIYCQDPQYVTNCASGTTCSAGNCVPTACISGYERCQGNVRQQCNGGSWSNVETCDTSCIEASFTNSYCELPTCSDSDNGLSYDVRGTVTTQIGGQTYTDTDYCVNANNVGEYYCNYLDVGLQSQFCSSGCSDGKCNPVTSSCGGSDSNNDGQVSFSELISYGASWKLHIITFTDLISAATKWKTHTC